MKTISDIHEEFLDTMRIRNLSPRTVSEYHILNRTFFRWLENRYNINAIESLRKNHLTEYQKYMLTLKNSKGLPCKPGYLNNRIGALRCFLRHAADKGYVLPALYQQLKDMKKPRILPTSVLTHTQVRKFLRSIDTSTSEGYMIRCIIEVLYSSAIRVGELVKLSMDDLDCRNKTLKVFGKGRKERIVPVGTTALRYLETFIKAVRPFMKGSDRHRIIFLNHIGNPMRPENVQRRIAIYARKAKLEGQITPHTFRRSACTELVKANVNLYLVKELLGHESLDTLKPYTKLTINDLKKSHAKYHPREIDVKKDVR